LKLLEQRPDPPVVASSDVPMFCNNIDLSNLEQMDPMTQRVESKNMNIKMNLFDLDYCEYRWIKTCE